MSGAVMYKALSCMIMFYKPDYSGDMVIMMSPDCSLIEEVDYLNVLL